MTWFGRRFARLRVGLATLLLILMLAIPARAADDEKAPFREPGIRYLPEGSPAITWVIATVLIAGTLFIAFKNPHRSHMD
jgi:hypothetical protein